MRQTLADLLVVAATTDAKDTAELPVALPPLADERASADRDGLVRKDVFLRDDQVHALDRLAEQLMKQRTRKHQRITRNTLLRVAADLLLDHAHELAGNNESELLRSILAPPTPRDNG